MDQIESYVKSLASESPSSNKYIEKKEKRQFICWTDGACSGNPGPGGWAFVITDRDGNLLVEKSGFSEVATSNRMEMTAIIRALIFIPKGSEVHIKTDSRLVANSYNKGWRRNKNLDLWRQFDDAIKRHKSVIIEWVKGHNKIELNERADHLATTAIKDRVGIVHSYENGIDL
ncbi:MAG: reverse transcriptase-like protein [Nitrospiraceae bacterium]|nr:reverse transcriptase-like protein [Nitrospiraceae bacterium]